MFFSKSSNHTFGVSFDSLQAGPAFLLYSLVSVVSGCMFLFGVISVAQGTVRNYSGLLATRFFLGLTECNAFPGCFYLIAM